MRHRRVLSKSLVLLLCLLAGYAIHSSRVTDQPRRAEGGEIQAGKLTASYVKLPLSFEPNQGQTNPRVRFLSRGSSYTLFLTGDEAVLSLRKPSTSRQLFPPGGISRQLQRTTHRGLRATDLSFAPLFQNPPSQIANSPAPGLERPELDVVRLRLVGASPKPSIVGLDELPGKSNYFIGNDPTKWRTNVPTYAKVKYKDVYPGVDLVYYGNQQQLEYDFLVSPGADPRAITLELRSGQSKIQNR